VAWANATELPRNVHATKARVVRAERSFIMSS
jgi:hypothetical protein